MQVAPARSSGPAVIPLEDISFFGRETVTEDVEGRGVVTPRIPQFQIAKWGAYALVRHKTMGYFLVFGGPDSIRRSRILDFFNGHAGEIVETCSIILPCRGKIAIRNTRLSNGLDRSVAQTKRHLEKCLRGYEITIAH